MLPTPTDFGIFLLFGITAGVLISDLQKALFGFLAAIWIGAILVFVFGTLPAATGIVQPPGDQAVYTLWSTLVFRAIFPVPFIISLFAALLGAGIGETYLETTSLPQTKSRIRTMSNDHIPHPRPEALTHSFKAKSLSSCDKAPP
jgi:hypothetical protein